MKIRNSYSWLLILIVIFGVSCEVSKEDVEQYLVDGEHEQIYNFLEESIRDRDASVRDLDSDEKTPFEIGLFGLLSSNSTYADKTGYLITQNAQRIDGHQNLEPLLWSYLLDHKTTSREVYQFLYESYDFKSPDEQTLVWFRSDSIFQRLLLSDLNELIKTNIFASNKIILLANAGNFTEVTSKLDEIAQLLRYKNAVQREINSIQEAESQANLKAANRESSHRWSIERAENRISKLKRELDTELEESIILRGYIVALFDEINTGYERAEVYEIRSFHGSINALITTETFFRNKGTFSMRVLESIDIPMKFKQEYGGFNTSIKSYMEVSSRRWEDYQSAKSEIKDLEAELDMLVSENSTSARSNNQNQTQSQRLSYLKVKRDNYANQISDNRKELVKWANKHTDL